MPDVSFSIGVERNSGLHCGKSENGWRQGPVTTELEQLRIDTADLAIGMFVCGLDRPWEETQFPLQGIEVRTDDDVHALRELCKYVYIDRRRELSLGRRRLPTLARSDRRETGFRRATTYMDKASVQEEMPRAREALQATSELLDRIYDDIASGRELSVEYVEQVVRPLVASVLRSSDAFLFLEGLRRHDNYTYSHAISCGALAAAFGRHLGLPEDTILSLATGGLLMDIGKTRLPEQLLRQPGPLRAREVELVRTHVAHGLDIVSSGGINDPDVLDVVRTHHERYDGSGYPEQLAGNTIPMAGRMLAIIDSYDAMCSVRPHRKTVSRHKALQEIYRARDILYQAELVEQFQVCLGVYPTGSRVELTTGEVAVVMEQNQVRRLRPAVLVISTPAKQPLEKFRVLDLLNQSGDGDRVEIQRALAIDEYDIDTAGFLTAA
ncbi:MAG: HD-GYP domain-containing protein [Xanthomonadaceae bacterium]|nr:HD-GYP domain-containing protein [Xanthomonadaceae bacterium]MDE2084065.1 HD-GYP domain-containing protein [Xanthomonadaceae bacterium]MDE2257025.1 HD-GYP domain-containing protein [Xanthomonadaceae bacterium]